VFANILLAGLLIVLIYLFADKLFGQKIALVSAAVVMLNPTMYALSVYVWIEILFCILLLLAFYFAIFPKNYYYFALSGMFAGMAYLTRYPGVVIVVGILIWLLFIRKNYKPAFIFGVFSFLAALPWFIRNYLLFNNPLFYTSTSIGMSTIGRAQSYPGQPSVFQYPFTEFLRYSRVTFLDNLSALGSVESLFILLPFVILGCALYMRNRNIQPLIIFSFLTFIVMSAGMSLSGWHCRYLIPIFIVLTPLGVAMMFKSIKYLMSTKSDALPILRDYRKIITLLLAFIFLVNCVQITGQAYYNITTNISEEKEAYKWLSDHTSSSDKTASTYPCDDHYFTGLESTLMPDVNETVMEGFIERFSITYFVIILNPGFDAYSTNITRELYLGNENVTVGSKNLSLVYRNDAVLIYQVC
ncbi:MAG: glycosyltransferase family 39 protein, partial [Candidatus Thermoplasmatota archaeon]|nr:glycosyltransferase family 39 protein [Candidatus Thermoplasmatota archaeon]